MQRYVVLVTVLTALITVILFLMDRYYIPFDPSFTWWVLPLAFYVISMAGHGPMLRSFRGKSDQFMIYFLLATTVKLLLYLGLLLVWFIISGQVLTIAFIIAFGCLYVTITALDLITILSFRKKES